MDYSKEFKKYATKHHGVSSTYFDKIISSMTPYIIEERQLNVAQMDVFSRLMMDRIMFLGTAITDTHLGVLIQGQIHVVSDDGSEVTVKAGDAYCLAPGHDAWVVGEEPAVGVEFSMDNKDFGPWTHGG